MHLRQIRDLQNCRRWYSLSSKIPQVSDNLSLRSTFCYTGSHGRCNSNLVPDRRRRFQRCRETITAGLRRTSEVGSRKDGSGKTGADSAGDSASSRCLSSTGGCSTSPALDSQRHFFAAAAEAMRRILIESARRKTQEKRGAGFNRIDWSDANPSHPFRQKS